MVGLELRMALLRHTLPDGSWHFDWLIEHAAGAERVMTFRAGVRVDEGAAGAEVTRLADHRRVYLEYEGEVSGGRGEVRRVAEGRCGGVVVEEGRVSLLAAWTDGATRRVEIMRVHGDAWRVVRDEAVCA